MAQVQPAVAPIQTRFDGGVISPRLAGRFDSELYKKALKECSNFEPLPQGSLRMRSGSEKNLILTGGASTRFAQIKMSTGEDFLVEFIDRMAHLYTLTGGVAGVQSVSSFELINNGSFSAANGAGWSALNGISDDTDDVSGKVHFTHSGAQSGFALLVAPSVGLANAGILYQKITLPFAGTVHIKFDANGNIGGGTKIKVKISTSDPAGWADKVLSGGEAFVYENVPPGVWNVASSFSNPPTPTRNHVDLGDVALAAGTYWFSVQGSVVDTFTLGVDNISLFATFGVAALNIPTPWTAAELSAIQFATETGRDRTVFVHPNHSPWFLLSGGTLGTWTFGSVPFTSLPLGWGDAGSTNVPPDWNWQGVTDHLAAANWPASIEMMDGRIYYAGEPAQKNRILASRSGSLDDFTLGANPGDALDFKLSTKGAIQWLRAHRVMLAGTDLGKHSITGSKGTPLVGDIQAKPESEDPCAPVQALISGTQAIYVSSELRRIRASTFDFRTQGFESKDLTFASEHLTKPLVKELHHARTPDNLLLLLLQDGTLAVNSFEPEEGVSAWWTANIGGTIYTAAVQQSALGAYLWMAVGRNGITYMEKLHLSESTEPLRYMDTSIAAVADANGQVVGLDHLNGVKANVALQAGGSLGQFMVVGGAIQLGVDNANAAVFAGLPFLARAVTLPRDLRHGKAQSPKVGVILNDSALPKLNGNRPPERTPGTPMGNVQPRITGKRIAGALGWSDEDSITIEQDLPIRTEICAVYSATQTEQNL